MPRVVALDVGERRIGLARGSTEAGVAEPAGVVERRSRDADVTAVAGVLRDEGAELIVVGLPLGQDNLPGEQAASILRFLRRLAGRTRLPVALVDEAGSSREAGERFPRVPVDAGAAAVILERYMQGRELLDPGLLA